MQNFFLFSSTGDITRKNPCCYCGSTSGRWVGVINYIGLERYRVAQCPTCGLASFDPEMDVKIVSKGYSLFYQLEHSAISRKRRIGYFRRDYRRGGYVARKYIVPLLTGKVLDILEIGASNGYFSQGIKYYFPESSITYIDIVQDFAVYYKEHFDCRAVTGEFSAALFPQQKLHFLCHILKGSTHRFFLQRL